MRCFVLCKHNCEREYENGDLTPDPSPDILLKRDFHRFTLTVPERIDLSTRSMKKVACKLGFFTALFVVLQMSQNTSECMLPRIRFARCILTLCLLSLFSYHTV
jgi:hypothetical protein